jgi:virulence-associated protein VapD
MTTNWMDYKVGQEVFIATEYSQYKAVVSKVGHKYVHIVGEKKEVIKEVIIKGTNQLQELGFGLTGTVYVSEDAYEESKKMSNLKSALKRHDWLSTADDQVKAIAEILGIES